MSSTEDDMKKAYRKLTLQSQPDKNKYPQASAMMCMINKPKEVLEDSLRYNDTMREQECIHTAQKYIKISSDYSFS